MAVYNLSALWMVTVKNDQPATMQNANKAVRDAPKLPKSRPAVLNLYVRQAGFLLMVTDLILLQRPPHKRKTSSCYASLLLQFVIQCRFIGLHVRHGHQVIRASHICSTKTKTTNVPSEGSGGISTKFCTIKIFRYTVLSSSCIFDNPTWWSTVEWRGLEADFRCRNFLEIITDNIIDIRSLLSFYIVQTQYNVYSTVTIFGMLDYVVYITTRYLHVSVKLYHCI